MTLKNSFFNLSLIREALRRHLWTITLSSITLFLSLPLPVIMTIQNAHTKIAKAEDNLSAIKESTTNLIFAMLSMDNVFLKLLMVALAIIAGISVFSHLHSKEKTDFYHSLPISRNKLFATRFIAGILTIIPAYLISYLLAVTIATSFGYTSTLSFNIILQTIAVNLVFFLSTYATGALCAILCGNTIVSMLLLAWLSFSPSVCVVWSMMLKDTFYKTFNGSSLADTLIARLSPIVQYFLISTKDYDTGSRMDVYIAPGAKLWLWLGTYFVVFVLITLLALWLNRHRHSEKAGSAIAFEKFKSPLKFFMVTLTAIGMGLLFKEIVNPFWMYIGFFIGGLLCHMIVEITYQFDFKAIFKNIKWFALFAVIFSICIAGMYFDITGYDRYLPSPDSLKSVNITLDNYISYSYSSSEPIPLENPDNIALVCKLAETGIAQRNFNFDAINSNDYRLIEVTFNKKFGLAKSRKFEIVLDPITKKIFDEMRYSEEYKKKRLPLFTLNENKTEVLELVGPQNMSYDSNPSLIVNKDNIKEIITTARVEWLSLTPEYLSNAAPVALMFASDESNSVVADAKYQFKTDYYSDQRIPIYPSFTKTLGLLKKYGNFEPRAITIDDVTSITLNIPTEDAATENISTEEFTKVYPKEIKITDPLDIAVLLQNALPTNLANSADPNFKINNEITFRVQLKNSLSEIDMAFPDGKVPSDVIKKYQ